MQTSGCAAARLSKGRTPCIKDEMGWLQDLLRMASRPDAVKRWRSVSVLIIDEVKTLQVSVGHTDAAPSAPFSVAFAGGYLPS